MDLLFECEHEPSASTRIISVSVFTSELVTTVTNTQNYRVRVGQSSEQWICLNICVVLSPKNNRHLVIVTCSL